MPVGTGQLVDATRALEAVGVDRRDDVYWALHATLVTRREQRPLFDLAFARLWRDPDRPTDPLELLPPDRLGERERTPAPGARRVREASPGGRRPPTPRRDPPDRDAGGAAAAWSPNEAFRRKDFEQMSEEEIRRARAAIARMELDLRPLPTRRFRPDPRGTRGDLRRTPRGAVRSGGYPVRLARRRATERPPDLVALCDISGSMDVYARMSLHFLHALTESSIRATRAARATRATRVRTFLFGTELTEVTRALRRRDVDEALAEIGREGPGWGGGTRIGRSLETFNRAWSRRVLGRGAVVLLITDGLDRGDLDLLGKEVARLRRSCRRLVWLNPLLRYADFEPRAGGVREILPRVDDFRPVHDLKSLEELAEALGPAG